MHRFMLLLAILSFCTAQKVSECPADNNVAFLQIDRSNADITSFVMATTTINPPLSKKHQSPTHSTSPTRSSCLTHSLLLNPSSTPTQSPPHVPSSIRTQSTPHTPSPTHDPPLPHIPSPSPTQAPSLTRTSYPPHVPSTHSTSSTRGQSSTSAPPPTSTLSPTHDPSPPHAPSPTRSLCLTHSSFPTHILSPTRTPSPPHAPSSTHAPSSITISSPIRIQPTTRNPSTITAHNVSLSIAKYSSLEPQHSSSMSPSATPSRAAVSSHIVTSSSSSSTKTCFTMFPSPPSSIKGQTMKPSAIILDDINKNVLIPSHHIKSSLNGIKLDTIPFIMAAIAILTYYAYYPANLIIFFSVLAVFTDSIYAENVIQTLVASDRINGDFFGRSVDVHDEYVVIGSPDDDDDDNGDKSGSVYVFKQMNRSWIQSAKLLPHDGAAGDRFGWDLAIYVPYILVGAYQDDDNGDSSGSAYIFKLINGSWVETTKLVPTDGTSYNWFGKAVDIYHHYALIAAHGKDAAYIFELVDGSWIQSGKLSATDGVFGTTFGHDVSIYDQYALISDYDDDDNGHWSGSAYIFERVNGAWIQTDKLLPADGAEEDRFGVSVSIFNGCAVIGAYYDDDNGDGSGSAYVFERINGSWIQSAKLLAIDGNTGDQFGGSISIDNEHILVGTLYGHSSYIFVRRNASWIQTAKLLPPQKGYNYFGWSVSIFNEHVLVGDPYHDSAHIMRSYSSCNNVWEEGDKYALINTNNDYLIDYKWTPCLFTSSPTMYPTQIPTNSPSTDPTIDPTVDPTKQPTEPTADPTYIPSTSPTEPTTDPTIDPTDDPTSDPTNDPSSAPTTNPAIDPAKTTVSSSSISDISISNMVHDICGNEFVGFINTSYKVTATPEICQEGITMFNVTSKLIDVIDIVYYSHELFVRSTTEIDENEFENVTICNNITLNVVTCFDKSVEEETLLNITKSIDFKKDIMNKTTITVHIDDIRIFRVENEANTSNDDDIWIWIATTSVSVLLCVCIIGSIFVYISKKQHQEMVIKNGMVILLVIGDYHENPADPDDEMENVYLKDLAIDKDVGNMHHLFGPNHLNYTISPQYDLKYPKIEWTQKEIICILQQKAEELHNNLINVENKFDALIVVISSHGHNNNIITSDYKVIDKTAIHRIFSTKYPKSREIPRIFLYDCCDGNNERGRAESTESGDDDDDEQEEKKEEMDVVEESVELEAGKEIKMDHGKKYDVDNIDGYDANWIYGDRNPDHLLVEIHAANKGFQSKLNSDVGSYMLHEFAVKYLDDLNKGNNKKRKCLYEHFDDIQRELADKGKQQIVPIYNDKTRYVVFKKNINDHHKGDAAKNLIEIELQQRKQ